MHVIAVERNNDSDPTFTDSPIRPEVWPSICHICHSRQWTEAAKPVLYLGSGAAESSMAINPAFFAWQCAKSPCYPVFSWFKYPNVQSFEKECCFLLLLINPDCRLRSQNWWLWLGEFAAVNGVRSSNLTGLDASVSRLVPTVNQTVCWYTIYIYTHPEGPYFDWCIIHPVIIIPIFPGFSHPTLAEMR